MDTSRKSDTRLIRTRREQWPHKKKPVHESHLEVKNAAFTGHKIRCGYISRRGGCDGHRRKLHGKDNRWCLWSRQRRGKWVNDGFAQNHKVIRPKNGPKIISTEKWFDVTTAGEAA
jgi:uncharacterized protein (UPF0218 family)